MEEKKLQDAGPAAVDIPQEWNQISSRAIGCAIEVHRFLGPGLLESLYEEALVRGLSRQGLSVQRQMAVPLEYKGQRLRELRLDLVVEDLLIIELKAKEKVPDVDLAQLLSHMRLGGYPIGLLINFHTVVLKQGIYRRINPDAVRSRLADSPSLRPLRIPLRPLRS